MSIALLRQLYFPNLRNGSAITSPPTAHYNCIAWAANDAKRRWWPQPGDWYWPRPHNNVASVTEFEQVFFELGYTIAPLDDSLVPTCEKIAIYVSNLTGLVTHMARQLPTGRWTSKLGPQWDIEHLAPDCLNGDEYGRYLHCIGKPI